MSTYNTQTIYITVYFQEAQANGSDTVATVLAFSKKKEPEDTKLRLNIGMQQ